MGKFVEFDEEGAEQWYKLSLDGSQGRTSRNGRDVVARNYTDKIFEVFTAVTMKNYDSPRATGRNIPEDGILYTGRT
jgi:hypothetical protein